MSEQRLSGDQISAMGLPDWRSMHEALQARFETGDFATGLKLVNAIGAAAEEMNHHPDLDLRYTHLNVKLMSHDVYGKTDRDVALARRISELAAGLGVRASPSALSRVEIGLDTWDVDEIRPFWTAVLGLTQHPRFDDDLRDESGDLPTLWFQRTDRHAEPRQRFHLDIRVPPEVAEARIRAALDAGGTLVSDRQAPRFTVLADPQGNKVCVCTQIGRSD
ncbi:MAG: 4a-hydroxytetrahydrobiopterin dehydratase [Actinobacteria bacterium 69-20]|nr:4a-hydroxytetrahydrobiopterin dehydratase [Actinomycetota bacterium]OJV24662.1 MAG: 4a-hydroxytetrahydrobiopterin dehydratase [Actinobacteria bacterium 69-20]